MKTQLKRFLLTLGFMTRIPVNVNLGEVKDEDMQKGFLYYPVVGLVIGLCDMAVYLLVTLVLPDVFGILFAMLTNLCVTGAFHLDGLSDTADGIYSARTKERMLEIMKDSRIGTNGAVAMCFDLALKFAGIYYSNPKWLLILLMPVAGKMVQGALVYKAIYPREKGIGIYVGTVSLGTVIGTVILGLIAMIAAFSLWGVLIFAVLFVFAYLFRVYITGKIGGITGDVMGAGSELSEVLLLLLVIILTKYAGLQPLSLFAML
ncbi:MAG: adenosylcobinamide-GDP ribazoletransferase [Eubacterium sp.]|nr:adenosylcobinamide-GDP ribazoletransferase [Eubacterium sp.]MDD7208490.1 adenosylcobinamide-GDP ribazoletransferase [Lachnospiraceae bacterium]MDY5497613.1 adenosylcobinamide-GDP ribazoletransferase [Anaerobutyricum sp.]